MHINDSPLEKFDRFSNFGVLVDNPPQSIGIVGKNTVPDFPVRRLLNIVFRGEFAV